MIVVGYAVVAVIVVMLSVRVSYYVDLMDQKSDLSGAFIGGVMLSAVTSFPELFTSITSTLFLGKPDLCLGNILGSDLFNLVILAVLVLTAFKPFQKANISKQHAIVTVCVILGYVAIWLNCRGIVAWQLFHISITSLIIVGLYIVSLKHLANEDGSHDKSERETTLTLKQVVLRFAICSVGIIGFSILITYITDALAQQFHLGSGIAGAIFLGVATSLPELSSSITLFRIKNYDIAFGNIVGSNIFNLMILAITDLLYVGEGLYVITDPRNTVLLWCGLVANVVFLPVLLSKKQPVRLLGMLAVIGCYAFFLLA